MLIIFNLDWKTCDIDQKIARATRNLTTLIETMGAGHYVRYDLTSLSAHETVFWKSTPPEKRIPDETLKFIREQHADVAKDLANDKRYQCFRDTAQMLRTLRGDRHNLAVVFAGDTAECDQLLRRARLREYFEHRVYGTNSLQRNGSGMVDLYNQAIRDNGVSPHDAHIMRNNDNQSLIVDYTINGIRASRRLDTPALAYISRESCADEDIAERGWRMREAGAGWITTTPQDITVISGTIYTRPDPNARLPSYVTLPGAVVIKKSAPGPA